MTRNACLNSVYELAKKDKRVVFIGSDLSPNTLPDFKKEFPNRFFMEGVQEQNIIGMAAGLALEGYIPYVNTISTFITRRCYEQVLVDIALHMLPVRLIGNGGGLLYGPLGATHLGVEDIAIMRAIPGMAVVNCSDNEEMRAFMQTTLEYPGPIYIRLGKDSDTLVDFQFEDFAIGKDRTALLSDKDANIVIYATGIMTARAVAVAKLLPDLGIDVVHVPTIKPLPPIVDTDYKLVVTMEESSLVGGFGSAILEAMSDIDLRLPVLRFGIPDAFAPHYGEQEDLMETYELTAEKMTLKIRQRYDLL